MSNDIGRTMGVLQSISLHDFRSYQKLFLEFEPGINVLIGPNGQGKTNLLEAIYFLSLLRSFRTHLVRNLLRWQQPELCIRGVLQVNGRSKTAAIQHGAKRQLRLNNRNVAKASEFIGSFRCVAMVPEDIELVKGSGKERRRFLDIMLVQQQEGYLAALQDYQWALKSRNSLLRRENVSPVQIKAFDMPLIQRGAQLCFQRESFFERYNRSVADHSTLLFPADIRLSLNYRPSFTAKGELADYEKAFAQTLQENLQRDMRRGHTHCGPHVDDFSILLNKRPLSNFGSEGQCRLAVLVLKITCADILAQTGNATVLLVDDVIGELDQDRRRRFFARLSQFDQTFLACTDETTLDEVKATAVFDVANGTVTRRN